jgi:MYXO-CTERM domain-containing protein
VVACPIPVEPDAGVAVADAGDDAGVRDAGAATPPPADDGCGCRAAGAARPTARGALALLALGLAAARRRRRAA